MASVTDFRKVVSDYLSCSNDRKVFAKRFAELFYSIHAESDLTTIEFAYAIDSYLGEAIAGLISEEDLRNALSPFTIDVCVSPDFRNDSIFRIASEKSTSLYEPAKVAFSH